MFGTAAWCPPCASRPRAPSSSPYWLAGIQHPNMSSSASQGTWWGPPSIGASANHVPSSDNLEDSDLQAWGSDSHPPGGFINFLNNAQVVSNGNSSQPIHIGYDINDSDSARTEKCLLWTKEEDLRLEPKWDAYLERLIDLDSGNRKSNEEDVGRHFSLDDARDERPIGGKQAQEQQKRKRKEQAHIIDLEDELHKFVDAQNRANEGRKEMLETQKCVSSEKLESHKLAYLAAKEHKESAMLETYRSLMMQDTIVMSEDVRFEHVLALRCFREKLFGKTE
ncbi:hypothetical protein GUJ93_ZPchr0006g43648 [Zizania palustris]|uniref:No apical meristem-associated C-terminal domain-containing protein n=1 Tax=Zizania palustris TaxID=103762 RepID=A0A8J5TAK9_ZIZPA|nr:hypothetical protein GUJ93_ZPchr0006g43648 [Zizania palustris]